MKYIWEQKNWPHFKWKSDRLLNSLSRARFAQGNLLSKIHSMGITLNRESQAEILIEETVKTAAIEGIILNTESVRASVAGKLGLPTAGLKKPDKNADGLIDILLDAAVRHKKALTAKRLKSWQAALFPTGYSGLKKIRAGKWRGNTAMRVVSGPIGREKVHFEAPPGNQIAYEIKKFITWGMKQSKETDGLLRAGIAHFYFVTIHPFEDGNGRIARALTDMALAQDENLPQRYYSLSGRIMSDRKAYYEILEQSQKGSLDITPWLLWFLKCYLHAVEDSEITITKVLQKSVFWQKHAQTGLNKHQQKVINRLLDAGRFGFEGGLSTKKYVSMIRTSRATAYRDIIDLVNKKILTRRKAGGRSVSYDLIFK